MSKEAYLPSSTLVRGSAYFVRILFVFEDMRLALKGQTDSLDTGRDQPDQHSDLYCQLKFITENNAKTNRDAPLGRQATKLPHHEIIVGIGGWRRTV